MAFNIDATKLPPDKEIASKIIDGQFELSKRELGFFGRIFGNREVLPFSITGFVLIALIIFLFVFMFSGKESETFTKKDVLVSVLPVITIIVGYFFGTNGKK
jgi:hypothetical protein